MRLADLTSRPWFKPALRVGGLVLLAVCLVYLVRALAGLDFERLLATMRTRDWVVTGLCAVAYGASLTFLAQAWAAIAAAGRDKLPVLRAVAIYGPGAVAKYLPGSVFHYASRHVLGRREELAHGAIVKASVAEIAMHVGIALAMAGGTIAGGWLAPIAGAAVGIALLAWQGRPLVRAFAYQALFFAAYAAIVLVLASFGAAVEHPARLAGLFFVAWTVGFLVPLAPGGIGVREAALLALAGPYETTDAIALVVLLARVVGIVGDGLFGLAGYFAATRLNRQASA